MRCNATFGIDMMLQLLTYISPPTVILPTLHKCKACYFLKYKEVTVISGSKNLVLSS